MFTQNSQNANSGLDVVIDDLLSEMKTLTSNTKEYALALDHLSTLYKIKEANSKKKLSPDTKALIAANLAGILVIVGFEKANVVTSKALSFVMKLR